MREPREPRLTRPTQQQGSGREPAFGRAPARPGRQEPGLFDLFPGRNDPQPGWDEGGYDAPQPLQPDPYADPVPASARGAAPRGPAVPPNPYGAEPGFTSGFGSTGFDNGDDYPDPFGRDARSFPQQGPSPQVAYAAPPRPPVSGAAAAGGMGPVSAVDPHDPFHIGVQQGAAAPAGWNDPEWDTPAPSAFPGRTAPAEPGLRREPMMVPPEPQPRRGQADMPPEPVFSSAPQGYGSGYDDGYDTQDQDPWMTPAPAAPQPAGRSPELDRYAIDPDGEGFFAEAPRRDQPRDLARDPVRASSLREPQMRDPQMRDTPPRRDPPPRREPVAEPEEAKGGMLSGLRLKSIQPRAPRMASPFPITGLPENPQRRSKTMLWAAVAAGVLLVGVAGWTLMSNRNGADGKLGAPTIMADPSPFKVRPADPGGMQVANQDKMVYERISPDEAQQPGVEKLLPEPTAPRAPEVTEPQRPTQAVIPAGPQAMETASSPPVVPPQPQVAAAPASTGGAVSVGQVGAPPMVASPPAPVSSGPAPSFNAPQPAAVETAPRGPAVLGPAVTGPAIAPAQPQAAPITPPVPAVPAARTAATGSFSVQLAALRDEVSVRKQWDGLKAKYPDLLGPYSMGIEKADLGEKGVFYRLRATGLPTEESARTLCTELAKQKVGCLFVGK